MIFSITRQEKGDLLIKVTVLLTINDWFF